MLTLRVQWLQLGNSFRNVGKVLAREMNDLKERRDEKCGEDFYDCTGNLKEL